MISTLCGAPLSLALLANTLTVDDDGPADYSSIAAAIAAPEVADGDVLIVEPGSYDGFTLGKALTITGRGGGARPTITSKVTVSSVTRFELVRLEVPGLHVQFVPEAATIEDCVISGSSEQQIGLIANACPQLTVSRSVVRGLSPVTGGGGAGLLAVQSCVSLAGSDIAGGDGGTGNHDGGVAVRALQACELLFAGGAVMGGAPGSGGGVAGSGIHVVGSVARVRGSFFDFVLPGNPTGGTPGSSFVLEAASTLVLGRVLFSGVVEIGSPSTTLMPVEFEPFLRNVGSNGLGSTGEIDLFGPPGALAVLLISEGEVVMTVPEFDGQLWLDPFALVFVGVFVTQGELFPEPCVYSIPIAPILANRSFRSQALFPTVPGGLDPGKVSMSNPVDVFVRP